MSLLRSLLGLTLAVFALAACGGSEQAVTEEVSTWCGAGGVPTWFCGGVPEDPNFVFAAQSATAQKRQTALNDARAAAQKELVSSLETKLEGMSKSFVEETGTELRRQYTALQAEVVGDAVQKATPKETQFVQQDDGTWRAIVLMELSIGRAAQEFLSKLKQNEEAYRRFRDSEASEEMCEAIEEYDEDVAQESECRDRENE